MVGLAFAKSLADNRERKKNSATAVCEDEAYSDSGILKDDDAYDVDAAVAEWVAVPYSIFRIFSCTCSWWRSICPIDITKSR